MEYIIGAFSLVSLVLNYIIYQRITSSYVVGTVEELAPAEYCSCKEVVELLKLQLEKEEAHDPLSQPTPMVTKEVYSAWKNQKEIPWIPPTTPPEPLNKAPNRGPLARPDGFV